MDFIGMAGKRETEDDNCRHILFCSMKLVVADSQRKGLVSLSAHCYPFETKPEK